MDLSYSTEYEAFRAELRLFLEENWSPAVREKARSPSEAVAHFRARATERGYLYRAVPRAYGGAEQEADVLKAQIIREELARVRAPQEVPGVGTAMLVPTLLEWGSEEQKQYFIPKTLTGEFLWAQGYSEPNAGSDLASLKTRAELRGGKWILNGQKIWSTLAQFARFMFVLARTEPDSGNKRDGISYLLLDLKQPGVTIRPLKQITGGSEFCEVFFDDAETPEEWIVGERGDGWRVSKSTLNHERSALGGAAASVSLFEKLLQLAKEVDANGRSALDQPAMCERLVELEGFVKSHLYSSYRQLSMAAHGRDPGVVSLMNKLVSTNIGHEVAGIAKDLMGDAFLVAPPTGSTRSAGAEKWTNQFMGSLGIAIAGGTSNIQRNIIAERGYGLPRDGNGRD